MAQPRASSDQGEGDQNLKEISTSADDAAQVLTGLAGGGGSRKGKLTAHFVRCHVAKNVQARSVVNEKGSPHEGVVPLEGGQSRSID